MSSNKFKTLQKPKNNRRTNNSKPAHPNIVPVIQLENPIEEVAVVVPIRPELSLTTVLNSPWQLYFHVDPDNWDKNSYHEFGPQITTLETYMHVMHNLKSINDIGNVNLYLFRASSHPRWEDKTNANGISWSIKTLVDDGLDNFTFIADKIVSENSLKSNNSHDINGFVNGISLAYKEIHYIIKVIISNKQINNKSYIDNDILNINKNATILWQNIML